MAGTAETVAGAVVVFVPSATLVPLEAKGRDEYGSSVMGNGVGVGVGVVTDTVTGSMVKHVVGGP